MAKIKTKFCTFCQCRHPEDEFSPGQTTCKGGRVENQKLVGERVVDLDPSYSKKCSRCDTVHDGLKEVREHFYTDKSRPDHFMPYCKQCDKESKTVGGVLKKLKLSYLSGKPLKFRKKLLSVILKIIKDEDRSIVRQLVEDFRHEKEPISFTGREWQIQILNDLSPEVAARKASQIGLTWVMERFVIALLMRYAKKAYKYRDHTGKTRARFPEAVYSFETEKKASSWSTVRLDKIKRDNPQVRDALKTSKSDAKLLMQFGRATLHLVGRATVSGVTTISGDIVVLDEKDRDKNPDISNQIASRILESVFMNTPSTRGLIRTICTPEVSGAGISLLMENSNYNEWEIFCVQCETWQVLTYPECIGNFYEKGEDYPVDEDGNRLYPFWKCMNCHEPIDWKTIGQWDPKDPDHYVNCRWVPRFPAKFNPETGAGIAGYQISFVTPDRTAPFFLAERDNPERDIVYLYNHMLGLPYDDESKTLSNDNFKRTGGVQWGYSGEGFYVLGCDHHPSQGGYIVIMKQIPNSIKPANPEGKWVLVYTEHVRNNSNLWDRMGEEGVEKGRIHELIMEYNIDVAVLDQEPDTNEVEKMIKEFSFGKRVWSCKSGAFQETFKFVEEDTDNDGELKIVCKIFEDKVAAIDWYFNKIRFGEILFPGEDCAAAERPLKDFIPSHTNLYKGEITSSRGSGGVMEKLAAMNIREVYKKRVSRVQDHWAMTGKFAAQAIRIFHNANRSMTGIAPPAIKGMRRIPGI